MKCRQCKSLGFTPSHRSREERLLSHFVPLRPYRCIGCNDRRWGFTDPIFNISRLFFLLAASLFCLFSANFFITRITTVRTPPENVRQGVAPAAEDGPKNEAVPDPKKALENPIEKGATGLVEQDGTGAASEAGTGRADPLTAISKRAFPEAVSSKGEQRKPPADSLIKGPETQRMPVAHARSEAKNRDSSATETATRPRLLRIHTYHQGRAAGVYLVVSGKRPRVQKNYMKGKPRWVIDLLDVWQTEPNLPKAFIVETEAFSKIRFGDHSKKGFFRIVFDLKPGAWPEPQLRWSNDHLLIVIEPD